jgi:tyrosyl-tRNA synthetase
MSISDALMVRYFALLADIPPDELAAIKAGGIHPMEAKKRLAELIVSEYQGPEAAKKARAKFETRFQRREVPDDAPVFRIERELWICELMKQLGFAASTSDARRLVGQGAVKVDGQTVTDVNFRFVPGKHGLIEVGRRRVARIQS